MTPEACIDRFKQISLAMEETVQIIETLDRISEGYRQLFQDYLLTLNMMLKASQCEGHKAAGHPEAEEIRRIIMRAIELSTRDPFLNSQNRPLPAVFESNVHRNRESGLTNSNKRRRQRAHLRLCGSKEQ